MNTRVLVFAGSRSQLLQHIPVERTVRSFRAWEPRLVLSSEKGDHALWAPLLEDYDITPCRRLGPAPASLSDASLLAHIMGSASLLMHREAPAAVLVYGHSVTTMAVALAATELGIPVIHVGAGQLPGDMDSPEGRHAEITDRLATLLCCLDPADERSLHTRLMERGTCVTGDTLYDLFEQDRRHSVSRLVGAPPGYVGYDEGVPACSPSKKRNATGQPSGSSFSAIFPGRRPSAAPTTSAPCWKGCRPCTPGRSAPSCWCGIRPSFPVSGNSGSRRASASCRLCRTPPFFRSSVPAPLS